MKIRCEYCDSYYDDSMFKCPHCGGHNKEESQDAPNVVNELAEQDSPQSKWELLIFVTVMIALIVGIILFQRNGENKKDAAIMQNAIAYWHDSDYHAAVVELNKIERNSKIYDEAHEYLGQIIQEYGKDTESKAEAFFSSGDYVSCLLLINSTENFLNGNEAIRIIKQKAGEAYSDALFESAKELYFSEGVSSAKAIVNEGLSVIPENKKLVKLKELLDSVLTVCGSDMNFQNSDGYFRRCSSFMNSYGDTLSGDLFTFLGNDWHDPWCEFITAEKYTSFSCKVDANIIKEEHQLRMKIFLDGSLAYDSGAVDRTWKGEDVVLDISGVYSVKIEVYNLVGLLREWEYPSPRMILADPVFVSGLSKSDFTKLMME